MTLDLEKMAREFVIANQPEPAKCMNCGKTQPMTVMATVDAYCPRAEGLGGHVYEFTITTGEEEFQTEVKRLVSFARSVQKATMAQSSVGTITYTTSIGQSIPQDEWERRRKRTLAEEEG